MKNDDYNKQMLVVLDDMAQSQRKLQFWVTFWSVLAILVFICGIVFTVALFIFGSIAK